MAVRALPWPALLSLAGRAQAGPGVEGLQRAQARQAAGRVPGVAPVVRSVAFVHTRRAGSLLVLGLIIAAVADIH